MNTRILGAALAAAAFAGTPAAAGQELLLRQASGFAQCHNTIHVTLSKLNADTANIRVEVDTGALYRVKYVAAAANLVFQCAKSAGTLEITRTTPGDLAVARR